MNEHLEIRLSEMFRDVACWRDRLNGPNLVSAWYTERYKSIKETFIDFKSGEGFTGPGGGSVLRREYKNGMVSFQSDHFVSLYTHRGEQIFYRLVSL